MCGVERAPGNDGRDSMNSCVGKGKEIESEREEQRAGKGEKGRERTETRGGVRLESFA